MLLVRITMLVLWGSRGFLLLSELLTHKLNCETASLLAMTNAYLTHREPFRSFQRND